MSKKTKIFITDEEKQLLVTYHNRTNVLIEELGKVTIAKKNLKSRESSILATYDETKTQEVQLLQNLEEKYGKGSVDRETGEFFPM